MSKYIFLLLIFLCSCVHNKNEAGWVPLFPTDSLKGWNNNHKGRKTYNPNTWSIKNGVLKTTGKPIGVLYSDKKYRNFELKFDWKHHQYAKNSGLFIWVKSIGRRLAKGTEIQILDLGYEEYYKRKYPKRRGEVKWFTCHGDVFPVGTKMTPFPPVGPDDRSFPSENRTKPYGNWNHYYIRAVDGVVRLSVNGKEVSGGYNIKPKVGPLAWEAEGGMVEFKNIMIRELPDDLTEKVNP